MSTPPDNASAPEFVVLYDGTCGFCDASVQWLLARDHARRLRFAALDSGTGAAIRARHADSLAGVDSIILVDRASGRERVLVTSDAALAIAALLPPPWRWARLFALVPRRLRDAAYRLIARNRHRILGRLESCRLPSSDERALFLP